MYMNFFSYYCAYAYFRSHVAFIKFEFQTFKILAGNKFDKFEFQTFKI